MFAKELHDQLEPRGVLCVSLHPGVIKTNLARHMGNWVTSGVGGWLFENLITDKTIPQGASTTLYGCLAPGLKGAFLAPPPRAHPHALSKPVNKFCTHPNPAAGGAYLMNCAEGTPTAEGMDACGEKRKALWAATLEAWREAERK